MEKKIWRQKWLEAINDLTSYDLQKIIILKSTRRNAYLSFIEYSNIYFDEVLYGADYKFYSKAKWLTPKEYAIIKNWHIELDHYILSFGDELSGDFVFADNKWFSILNKGVFVKERLKLIIPESEKHLLE